MGFGSAVKNTIVTLLLLAAGGALSTTPQATAIASKPALIPEKSQNQIAQAQRIPITWRSFVSFIQAGGDDFQIAMLPQSFPNGFANGQVAFVSLGTGSNRYIVAREGIQIPNQTTVQQQANSLNILFNGNVAPFLPLPAVSSFPNGLYSGSNIIEIAHWAARFDDSALRQTMRQARSAILPNGNRAYLITQYEGRTGWYTLADERAQYSEYLCVNIANSPQTAFGVLSLIVANSINSHY
jgi:hypothetical protein